MQIQGNDSLSKFKRETSNKFDLTLGVCGQLILLRDRRTRITVSKSGMCLSVMWETHNYSDNDYKTILIEACSMANGRWYNNLQHIALICPLSRATVYPRPSVLLIHICDHKLSLTTSNQSTKSACYSSCELKIYFLCINSFSLHLLPL